jgi:DNA invertase Pin-like site-specific DNA recombinase
MVTVIFVFIGESMNERPLIPVAQYLRMSTDYQEYSLENQRAALALYASEHGMTIVQTYSDPGCSGLELKRRPGLRQLLQDVVSKPLFQAVIVYDVSRWGRFQDPDEAAHYEFVCKSVGIPVHYSSELFVNDGSPASVLLKQLKRTMAGEYSRELGVKVYAGAKRLVEMGHKMGGTAGFGLRRCLVSADGRRQVLEKGQRKTQTTDRVALVPGPASEVKIVREMFQLVAERGFRPGGIVRLLNSRGIRNSDGKLWAHQSVTWILTNPKYTGINVWGRTTSRLHTKVRSVPQNDWVSRDGAFEPLIDRALFDRVQHCLAHRTVRQSNDELLEDLRKLWKKKGKLSKQLVASSDLTPCPYTYVHRFGGLVAAYELIGYKVKRDSNAKLLHRNYWNRLRDELLTSFQTALPNRVRIVRLINLKKSMLLIDGSIPCTVIICPAQITAYGQRRWLIRTSKSEQYYPSLLCVLDSDNSRISRMYLCPPAGRTHDFTKRECDPWFGENIRIRSIDQLCSELLKISRNHPIPSSGLVAKTVKQLKPKQ